MTIKTIQLAIVAGLCLAGAGIGRADAAEPPAAPAVAIPAGWEQLQEFYDAHESARDFMPFGMFGYATDSCFRVVHDAMHQFNSSAVCTSLYLDSMVDINCNSIWGGLPLDASATPKLSDYERAFYGEILPRYGIRTMAGFPNTRYNGPALAKFQRADPPLTADEVAEVEKSLTASLEFARDVSRQFPQSILGFVSDDEPDLFAPSVAAANLVRKYTGKPATFTSPTFGRVQIFSRSMQPIVGDWYVCGDGGRDSWSIASNLRWMAKERPGRLFWFMPLTGSWLSGQDPTLPTMPDARTLRTELRLQCWSALALGAKAFYGFQQGEWCFSWGQGQDGVFDVLKRENDHHPRQHLAAEYRELGRDFTTIGPSLLTAYPALTPAIPIACGRVHYAAFKGPAIDCGLLRDPRAGRDFLVPWNNDIDREQSGVLSVPAELLAGGRAVYDLHTLEQVALAADGTLRVTLPPGGGRIYLVGDARAFAAVRDDVLRHRVWPDRARARSLVQRRAAWPKTISFEQADALLTEAAAAEQRRDWPAAGRAYAAAVQAMRKQSPVAAIEETLERAGAFLSQGDDLLRTHGQNLYSLTSIRNGYRGYGVIPQMFAGVPIASEMDRWVSLAATYVSMKQQLYAGRVDWDTLADVRAAAERLTTDSEAVLRAMQEKVDTSLRQARKPWRVAYVTPDREASDAITTYAWVFRKLDVSWIAPDDKGVLRDESGKPFVPSNHDVVWVRQTMYHRPPADGAVPTPEQALLPGLMEPATLESLREFVRGGGGLMLTGVAGLYAVPLGVETAVPDRLDENHFPRYAFNVGLIPAPGAEKHPALAHVPEAGLLTLAGHPGEVFTNECAWEKNRPAGTVLAQEFDDSYGRLDDRAAMVEYALGRGKVLVLGGVGTNTLKASSAAVPVLMDAVGYLAGKERFGVQRVEGPAARRQQIVWLPVEGWKFALDTDKVGTEQGWFKPDHPDADWAVVSVKANWEVQGFPSYDGHAWYRFPIEATNRPGFRTMLHFGAVDEEAVVYLDGALIGKHEKGWEGWNLPFAFDITDALADGVKKHLLAVRVSDTLMAGGIWKPVSLRYEPEGDQNQKAP